MSHLPDCMMPDGAEPCKGYQELRAKIERLREELEMTEVELAEYQRLDLENSREIERLRRQIEMLQEGAADD